MKWIDFENWKFHNKWRKERELTYKEFSDIRLENHLIKQLEKDMERSKRTNREIERIHHIAIESIKI